VRSTHKKNRGIVLIWEVKKNLPEERLFKLHLKVT
jgi:hypothetical protein